MLGNSELNPFIMGILGLGFWSFIAFAMIRFGLLAVVMWFAFSLMVNFPTTTDLSAWYAGRTVILFVFFIALACYGFWISLAGRPLFAKDLLEEPAQ